MRWPVSCVAFSGFFLREDAWRRVAPHFARFACLDRLRDGADLSMADYVGQAERALTALPPPYLILGHSFGAVPARWLAQRMPPDQTRLVSLAGLALGDGEAAADAYRASGQAAMAEHCRLDLASGRIVLVEPERFVRRLHAPGPPPGGEAPTASEPCAMITESLPLRNVPCRQFYVVCRGDEVADAAAQERSAASLGAIRLEHRGGHLGPLLEPDWLDAACAGWPTEPRD